MTVQIGQILSGKYRVERVLGRGGMGIVVEATHVHLHERVAVKMLLPEALENPSAPARFLREARAAVKIHSEFVARVTDVGTLEETGVPYMVMEYLDGQDLEHVIKQRGRLPIDEAVEYVLQACAALAEAHSLGIIHRDLKPANLFRTVRSDGAPVVKVLDFGISKVALDRDSVAQAGLTATSAMLGTPMYMSPEQIRSTRDVDVRTDVWSLGSILHELLCGDQPFLGDSLPSLFASILESTPVPLRQIRPDAPEELERIIAKCLAKNRDERYGSVAELAGALVPFGPPNSAELAGRAAKVLGLMPATQPIPLTHPSSPPPARGVPSTTPLQTSQGQTGVAWGGTAEPKASRRVVFITTALAGLAVVIGLAAVGLRQPPSPEPVASSEPLAPVPVEAPKPTTAPIVAPALAPSVAAPQPSLGTPQEPPTTVQAADTAQPAARSGKRKASASSTQVKATAPASSPSQKKENPLRVELK